MRWLPFDIHQTRILTAFLFSASVLGFAAGQQVGHLVRSPDRAQRAGSGQIHAEQAASLSPQHVTARAPASAKKAELVHVVALSPTPTPTAAPTTSTQAALPPQTTPQAQAQGSDNGKSGHAQEHHNDKAHGKAKDHSPPKAVGREDSGPKHHGSGSTAGASDHPGHSGQGHGKKNNNQDG